ncbi:hypothetical protein CINS5915_00475 [Campylobacter insulaenigrae]|nr:hypothetical protein [Campylobacter insulaenigrae]MCR6570347.1 hypothetical protein [Campylobacter insulaenigrae]MCR6571749.1 hypothetical protein [Campylobacter insulaenigrae]MCR6573386.1 hypothetical protein [Campylobacter insulaenigrae]MCR6574851.1 hypothetical protein [Campylobacter insulaenigrae]MCR6576457.1 hypothetical protein [Campylobacter insulaenigrae]
MLLYAGVKKTKIEEAIECYIDCIDDVCSKSTKEGVDEILEVVEYLRNHHGNLFV